MSQVARGAIRAFAPLAKGPLPKPSGMRNGVIDEITRRAVPGYVAVFAVFGVTYYLTFHRRMQAIKDYMKTVNPHELNEEIKEYGLYEHIKASWQEEE